MPVIARKITAQQHESVLWARFYNTIGFVIKDFKNSELWGELRVETYQSSVRKWVMI